MKIKNFKMLLPEQKNSKDILIHLWAFYDAKSVITLRILYDTQGEFLNYELHEGNGK